MPRCWQGPGKGKQSGSSDSVQANEGTFASFRFAPTLYFSLHGIHSCFIKAAKQSSLEYLHLYSQEIYANAQDALEVFAFGSATEIK